MSLSASAETITNTNLAAATRSLMLKGVKDQVVMKQPLLARLALNNRVNWQGGTSIHQVVRKADMASLVQPYQAGEPMTVQKKSLYERPWFNWRLAQIPLVYDVEEKLQNMSGGGDTQIFNLATNMAKLGLEGLRIYLIQCLYGIPASGTTAFASSDDPATNSRFQSLVQALTHDATYGHLTRATTVTNPWWQGGSISKAFTDQSTDYGFSVNTLRQAVMNVSRYAESMKDLLALVGDTGFLALKREIQGALHYNPPPGMLVKYGFDSFEIDGVEVVHDPWLDTTIVASASAWMFVVNTKDYELRLHPSRAFEMEPFQWQGNQVNGVDQWLSRIMLAGNFVCWKPNGSLLLLALT